jgi:uncharacterized membrane protein YbaN (DUF454 family)
MKIKNLIFFVLGFICLGLGAFGVAVPVLPTTPFVLLAAICFSIANKKTYEWLKKNPVFGPYIENYRTRQGIKMPLKIGSIAFLWAGLIISMILVKATLVYVVLGLVGIGVSTHILLIKTKR